MSVEKYIEKIRSEKSNSDIFSEKDTSKKIEEYANKKKKSGGKKIEIKFKDFYEIEIICSPDNIKYLDESVEKHKSNLNYLTYRRYKFQIKKLKARKKYQKFEKKQ